MNGFVRELPPSGDERHFEFHRKADGELVELTASKQFTGPVPQPDVLVNAHINPLQGGGQMYVDKLVVVG